MASGARIGGYGWLPLLAWTGLFATLGWNFLDYGLVNPPEGQGIEWGYVIPGVLFQLMAWVPVAFVLLTLRAAEGFQRGSGRVAITADTLRGAGSSRCRRTTAGDTRPADGRAGAPGRGRGHGSQGPAACDRCADGRRRDRGGRRDVSAIRARARTPGPPAELPEGTQDLLDRLERLADMRDRGLLTAEEYETAKDAVMHELEART